MRLDGEDFQSELPATVDPVRSFRDRIQSFPKLNGLAVEYAFSPCRITAPQASRHFDWRGVQRPNVPFQDIVIYEAHIRALTEEGTFAAARAVVPYFKWLGVTAVQLMPIFEFSEVESALWDRGEHGQLMGEVQERRGNMWGYSPVSWFCPMNRYAREMGGGAAELKEFVRALHEVRIECFLDVVYNHSANACCAFHFLKVQPDYYIGRETNSGFEHSNLSGCGNTLSPNSPMMMDLLMESLRWFVTEYMIDGFRIDAAGILCRDQNGKPIRDPPVITRMCADPVLRNTKFIVEGWDAGDQVGSPNMLLGSEHGFPRGDRFCEWNVEWKGAVRRYLKGEQDSSRAFCKALRGSAHLFGDGRGMQRCRPLGAGHGVNFVACHDGFCMLDVVSYEKRVNKDGYDEISFNCGAEGETEDAEINATRARQLRNFFLILAISRGIPMISQGDELAFSKRGNSNTWNSPHLYAGRLPDDPRACDNAENIIQFAKRMFDLRRCLKQLRGADFFESLMWLNKCGMQRNSRRPAPTNVLKHNEGEKASSGCPTVDGFVAFRTHPDDDGKSLYVGINNSLEIITACLPRNNIGMCWEALVDTKEPDGRQGCSRKCRLSSYDQITICKQSSVLYREEELKSDVSSLLIN